MTNSDQAEASGPRGWESRCKSNLSRRGVMMSEWRPLCFLVSSPLEWDHMLTTLPGLREDSVSPSPKATDTIAWPSNKDCVQCLYYCGKLWSLSMEGLLYADMESSRMMRQAQKHKRCILPDQKVGNHMWDSLTLNFESYTDVSTRVKYTFLLSEMLALPTG